MEIDGGVAMIANGSKFFIFNETEWGLRFGRD